MSEDESGSGAITWGRPSRGLRLGLAAGAGVVGLHLENVGAGPLEVLSHVEAEETHLDWYGLTLEDAGGRTRRLHLSDRRDKSGAVSARLEPGEGVRHELDVSEWAARAVNGAEPLAPGTYQLSAVYEVDSGEGAWSGRLEAGPVTLNVARGARAGGGRGPGEASF